VIINNEHYEYLQRRIENLEEENGALKRKNAELRDAVDRSCNAEELRRIRADNERLRAILACYRG
jgi:FtsZ-binding cell division protein ZapB